MRVHRQQGIGVVALRSTLQRCGVSAFQIGCRGDDLLIQVRQRQAQRQPTMLGGPTQRRGAGLAVTYQARTFCGVIQPPGQNRRPIGTPHRQPRPAQSLLSRTRIEIDFQHFRRPGFKAVLADDLLRIFANRRQPRVLRSLGITGQAQHQGVQRTLSRLFTLLG
ncbi:hypothetical protein D3C81_1599600 [compost metagenome]